MRRLLALSVVMAIAACSGREVTEPQLNVISVRVVDDAGTGVGRMSVTAMMSNGTTVTGVTRKDGTLRIGVSDAGVYRVSLVPREGYLRAQDPLVRTIAVEPEASASVQFQVWRVGVSQAEPTTETLWW